METCDPIYRPTNFWVPGMRQLSANLHARELDSFKSWPGASLVLSGIRRRFLQRNHQGNVWVRGDGQPQGERVLVSSSLNGSREARRDFDAARLFWDQSRWPFDLNNYGESREGRPPQRYRMTGSEDVGWGKPYLNYLLCLAALSRHVHEPPRSFIEMAHPGSPWVCGLYATKRGRRVRIRAVRSVCQSRPQVRSSRSR